MYGYSYKILEYLVQTIHVSNIKNIKKTLKISILLLLTTHKLHFRLHDWKKLTITPLSLSYSQKGWFYIQRITQTHISWIVHKEIPLFFTLVSSSSLLHTILNFVFFFILNLISNVFGSRL